MCVRFWDPLGECGASWSTRFSAAHLQNTDDAADAGAFPLHSDLSHLAWSGTLPLATLIRSGPGGRGPSAKEKLRRRRCHRYSADVPRKSVSTNWIQNHQEDPKMVPKRCQGSPKYDFRTKVTPKMSNMDQHGSQCGPKSLKWFSNGTQRRSM